MAALLDLFEPLRLLSHGCHGNVTINRDHTALVVPSPFPAYGSVDRSSVDQGGTVHGCHISIEGMKSMHNTGSEFSVY